MGNPVYILSLGDQIENSMPLKKHRIKTAAQTPGPGRGPSPLARAGGVGPVPDKSSVKIKEMK